MCTRAEYPQYIAKQSCEGRGCNVSFFQLLAVHEAEDAAETTMKRHEGAQKGHSKFTSSRAGAAVRGPDATGGEGLRFAMLSASTPAAARASRRNTADRMLRVGSAVAVVESIAVVCALTLTLSPTRAATLELALRAQIDPQRSAEHRAPAMSSSRAGVSRRHSLRDHDTFQLYL
eukprot:6182982-Pleurochrysis_carterae.AAC.4